MDKLHGDAPHKSRTLSTMNASAPCSVKSAHRRLMDCHEQWHAAADNYMEPDGFRMHLGNLAQNLRNVTWLLQKQRSELPDFQSWYGEWQQSVATDPVMKWLIKSRNRVVKESDLDLMSNARVKLSMSWLHEFDSEWQMPARFRTRDILVRIASTYGLPPIGILTIERRWIDKFLPEWELLEALAYVYSQLVRVIEMAHAKSGVAKCDLPSRKTACVTSELAGMPLCMIEVDEARRIHVDLSNRTEISESIYPIERDDKITRRAKARYGNFEASGNAIDIVPYAMEVAKRLLAADEELMTVAWLIRDDKMVSFFPMIFTNQAAKRIAMHRLADQVQRAQAEGVVLLAESWLAELDPDENLSDSTILPAGERSGRMEALHVSGITSDGRIAELIVPFSRASDGTIIYNDPIDIPGQNNLLEPLRRKWAAMENPSPAPAGDPNK